ncbi:MAG: magnetosome biogenesis transporter MamN [Rhodospirillales bacterium]
MNAGVTIFVFFVVFAVIYRGTVDRRVAVLSGAAVILAYGLAAGFFSLGMALDSIYFETLALIFGMSAISAILARSGLFLLIATRTAAHSKGNGWWLLVIFSLVTYGLSLLINNLATMVVILPVTLTVCKQMEINPVPLLIAEIIASNLGGASTMVGDFPNMIISSAGQLHFLDFIGGMMVPCLVLLAVTLGYFQWRRAEFDGAAETGPAGSGDPSGFLDPATDPRLIKIGLSILGVVLVGFLFSDVTGLRPGWIALTAGVVAIILAGGDEGNDWFTACGGQDILFFAGLFVMVGGLVAADALDGILWLIDWVSDGRDLPMMLALMWIAAFVTIFLNAGAATAFFVPIASGIDASLADPTVWWALSLGVLAGSSAALTGATAGPVAASHLDRFVEANPEMQAFMPSGTRLDFKGYLRWGLPIMGLFLVVSSFYIIVVAR